MCSCIPLPFPRRSHRDVPLALCFTFLLVSNWAASLLPPSASLVCAPFRDFSLFRVITSPRTRLANATLWLCLPRHSPLVDEIPRCCTSAAQPVDDLPDMVHSCRVLLRSIASPVPSLWTHAALGLVRSKISGPAALRHDAILSITPSPRQSRHCSSDRGMVHGSSPLGDEMCW